MATKEDYHDSPDEESISYPQNPDSNEHVVNVRLQAAGEAGSRITAVLLAYLQRGGVVDAEETPVGEKTLSVASNQAIDINASFADVDHAVAEELEVVLANNPALRDYIIDESLLTIIGGGGGKAWRRVAAWFDEYDKLDQHLENAVSADPVPHFNLDIAGAVGATGAAHIRRHIDKIRDGELPSPASHTGVYAPVTVGPALRLTDQRIQAVSSEHERRAFDSLFDHRSAFRKAIADEIITCDIFADNALLSAVSRIHHDQIPISELRELHLPVRKYSDWSSVIDAIQYDDDYDVNNAVANDALIHGLLPALYTVLRPDGVHFDQGDSVFDRADFGGALNGVTWTPGHFWLDDISDLATLVPEHGQPANPSEALYPASQYAAYCVPAGFEFAKSERAIVFVHVRNHELDNQEHGLIRRTLAEELSIPSADVATVEIDGLESRHFPADNDPELAINVLVGVEEIENSYRKLGKQTL